MSKFASYSLSLLVLFVIYAIDESESTIQFVSQIIARIPVKVHINLSKWSDIVIE